MESEERQWYKYMSITDAFYLLWKLMQSIKLDNTAIDKASQVANVKQKSECYTS